MDAEGRGEPLPPPRKGDVLFGPDRKGRPSACLHLSANYAYTEGYRIAARTLAKQVCETGEDRDLLIFPIIYLYRHHLELRLKRLIVVGAFLIDKTLDEPEIKQVTTKHNLNDLWTTLKPFLRSVNETWEGDPIPTEDLDGIDSYVKQLTKVDPDSQAARYEFSTKGAKSISGISHINIGTFSALMERLAAYLDGIDSQFSAHKDSKNEFLSESSKAISDSASH